MDLGSTSYQGQSPANTQDNDDNGYVDCDDYGCSRNAAVTVCVACSADAPDATPVA